MKNMDPQKKDHELESLLDHALNSYSEAEPSWGFEDRILARARAEDSAARDAHGQAPRRWWMWWPEWAAVAALIVIAAAIPFAIRTRNSTERTVSPVAAVTPPAKLEPPARTEQPRAAEVSAARKPVIRKRVRDASDVGVAQAMPVRQQVFPAPSAMSAQERVLMAWADSHPQVVDRVAQEKAAESGRLPEIQGIKVEPLHVPEIGGELK